MQTNEKNVLTIYLKKSITRAAETLGISQPALSASLSSLEKKIGFEIFDRKMNPLSVTKEGEAYIEYLYKKKELELDLEHKISNIQSNANITISIGAPSAYIETCVIPAISDFVSDNSDTNFILSEGTVPFLEKQMLSGELDFFLSTSKGTVADFNYEPIGIETIMLCVPIDSRWSTLSEIKDEDLSDANFIFLHPEQPLQQIIDNYCKNENINLTSKIRVDQISSAIKLVEMGKGVCFVSDNSVRSNDKVKLLPIAEKKELLRELYIVTSKRRFMPRVYEEFIEILKQQKKGCNLI